MAAVRDDHEALISELLLLADAVLAQGRPLFVSDVFSDTLSELRRRGVPHKVLVVGEAPVVECRDELVHRLTGSAFTAGGQRQESDEPKDDQPPHQKVP